MTYVVPAAHPGRRIALTMAPAIRDLEAISRLARDSEGGWLISPGVDPPVGRGRAPGLGRLYQGPNNVRVYFVYNRAATIQAAGLTRAAPN